MSQKLILSIMCVLFLQMQCLGSMSAGFEHPRMAVVISKTSFEKSWDVTQMSGHGWVGIANLAGIPYHTLFLEDIAAGHAAGHSLTPYSLLVLAQCVYVEPEVVKQLVPILNSYLERGGHLIMDGPLAAFPNTGQPQAPNELWSVLGITAGGLIGDNTCRIQVVDNHHAITRLFELSQFLSQPLAKPLQIQRFSSGGQVLLASTNGHETFPFLSCRDTGKSRLVLFSDATIFAGAISIFRNEAPNGFFANQVINALVRAVQWALYGDLRGPFPAPQFSNANLAVLIRLDADNTANFNYQKQTFDFLFRTARESGVVPLYCWVSSQGQKAGWKELAVLGQQLEDLGGQIGTHSKYHRIKSGMGSEKYKEELDGSIEEIESNMTANGAHIGKVEWFINPGDTIINSDYEELAKRFPMVMTHGFEQDTPIGSGVMSWFTGNHKDFVVLDDTPSPDYQWFYDPTWSYTTAQITNYQEATFDHLFNGIGRGYIYNQMWHDYSISSMPLRDPYKNQAPDQSRPLKRIANSSNIAMYEALKSKFSTYPVYCPEPREVVEKLRAMAGWDYSWEQKDNHLQMTLDLGGLPRASTADFIGGMGIRLENITGRIQSVSINGQPHDAFTDQVVILPNLNPGKNSIQITLAAESAPDPHLVYVSSRMPFVRRTKKGIEFQLLTKSKARFSLRSSIPGVVLHADWQEYNRKGDGQLTGFVNSDRTLQYAPLTQFVVALTSATVPLSEVRTETGLLRLILEKGSLPERKLLFTSVKPIKEIRLAGHVFQGEVSGLLCQLTLPEYQAPATLEIRW